MSEAYARLCAWENLLDAYRQAARGKRGRSAVAAFEFRLADRLLDLQRDLERQEYRPGPYVHFHIHEPKRRKISAAPFRDRIVHHALCNIIGPRFERLFIPDSYANRVGKGTHRAVDRLQAFSRRYRYVLRADIVKHFPSIDHAILRAIVMRVVPEDDVMALVDGVLASGAGVLEDEYEMVWFPGDDLLAACRPRGLPIGNLTSQFWSNCYLHPFDQFVTRELCCRPYLRYVDDFALFSDNKQELWAWKRAIVERLARLRLVVHEDAAQVVPVRHGIPWLGFVVYPTHRRVKARKVRSAVRHLGDRLDAYEAGAISFGELDASIKGWVNHVRHGDTWGLRREVFARLRVRLGVRGRHLSRAASTTLGTGTRWGCARRCCKLPSCPPHLCYHPGTDRGDAPISLRVPRGHLGTGGPGRRLSMLAQRMTHAWLLSARLEANLNARPAGFPPENALVLPGDLAANRNVKARPAAPRAALPLNALAAARYLIALQFGVNRGEGRAAHP